MNNEVKKELFPYFAYLYSKENKPAKYGDDMTFNEWYDLIKEDSPLLEEITDKAVDLPDEEWQKLEKEYEADSTEDTILSAKNGSKLNNIKKLRSMKKKNPKKCVCGCDLIEAKDKGGKLTTTCACGCKASKMKMKRK